MFLLFNTASIIYRLIITQSTERVMAAINTVGIGYVATLIYLIIVNVDFESEKIQKYMFINFLILIIFAVFFYIQITFDIQVLPSFVLGRMFYRDDWLSGIRTLRMRAYIEYETAILIFTLGALPWFLDFLKIKTNLIVRYVLFFMSFLPIYFSNSRMGWLVCGLIYGIIIYFEIKNKTLRILLIFLALVMLLIIVVEYNNIILEAFYDLFYSRSGSNDSRMRIYSTSITMTLQESPIIGIGIKYMQGNYPLGSHSSYIGFFYRAGFLGLIPICMFMVSALKKLYLIFKYHISLRLFSICTFGIFLGMLTDDIDGTNWGIVLLFINLGWMSSKLSDKKLNR
jgi:hypothetical protein